jgi:hypothetical protein
MPPLMDDPIIQPATDGSNNPAAAYDGMEGVETPALNEVELNLAAKVDAMTMPSQDALFPSRLGGRDASQPIIQFPDDEGQGNEADHGHQVQITMTTDMLAHMKRLKPRQGAGSDGSTREHGPRPSDMIPALQGLSSLQVSFGSLNDVSMSPADTVLGKRTAEEQEVQGGRLELSLGLNYEGKETGGTPKKGKMQGLERGQAG